METFLKVINRQLNRWLRSSDESGTPLDLQALDLEAINRRLINLRRDQLIYLKARLGGSDKWSTTVSTNFLQNGRHNCRATLQVAQLDEKAKQNKETQGRVLEQSIITFQQGEVVNIDAAGRIYEQRAAPAINTLPPGPSRTAGSATQNTLEEVSRDSRSTRESESSLRAYEEMQAVCRNLAEQVQQCISTQNMGRQRQVNEVCNRDRAADRPAFNPVTGQRLQRTANRES